MVSWAPLQSHRRLCVRTEACVRSSRALPSSIILVWPSLRGPAS